MYFKMVHMKYFPTILEMAGVLSYENGSDMQ